MSVFQDGGSLLDQDETGDDPFPEYYFDRYDDYPFEYEEWHYCPTCDGDGEIPDYDVREMTRFFISCPDCLGDGGWYD